MPHTDGLASLFAMNPAQVLRLTAHGIYDLVRGALRLAPRYIPASGAPGSLALITAPEADKYLRLVPDGHADWTGVLPLSQPRLPRSGIPRRPRHQVGAGDRRARQTVQSRVELGRGRRRLGFGCPAWLATVGQMFSVQRVLLLGSRDGV